MIDDAQVVLTRRWPRYVALGLAAIAAIGLVVVIIGIATYRNTGPSADQRRALADEECPRVTAQRLYSVRKDGKTSYMLGTRHAGVGLDQYPPEVAAAFRSARTTVFEVVFDAMTPAPAPAKTVEEELGPEMWDKYRELVGNDTADEVNTKPIFSATAALTMVWEDTSRAIDVELQRLARSLGKPVLGLDDAPSELPEASTSAALLHGDTKGSVDKGSAAPSLEEVYLGKGSLRIFIMAANNRDRIENMTRHTLHEYCTAGRVETWTTKTIVDNVTSARTHNWLPRLERLFADGDVFVAVGLIHIEADTQLIDLLAHDGYEVRPVPIAARQ